MNADNYIIYGIDPSYFTQKGVAILRYKGLPFEYRHKTMAIRQEIEQKAGSHLIPVVVTPEGKYTYDTTPVAMALDARYPEGAMLPPVEGTPRQRIVARLLEDYFDEWVTRLVIHFRWFNEADTNTSGVMIARQSVGIPEGAKLTAEQQVMVDTTLATVLGWGRGTCEKVGSGEKDAAQVNEEFARLLECLEGHYSKCDYLLGPRPSLGDMALWGGLEAHFLLDPTPRAIIERDAPALLAFHCRMKDARGASAAGWPANDAIPESLTPLLKLIGETFHRFLPLNAAALAAGEKSLEFDFGYGSRTISTRKYTENCRAEIAAEVAALSDDDREKVKAFLDPLGCWAALAN